MSGHSKWTQIKRQKGVADVKRGQLFTKLGSAISMAAKSGGGDIASNIRLRLAIEQARAANMPKENIQRALDRGLGKLDSERSIEEVIYEGYAPLGVGVIIHAMTDNKQRTVSLVKNILEKSGGSLATQGSVSWQFQKRILLTVRAPSLSMDDAMLALIDAGAEDVEAAEDTILVYIVPELFDSVKDKIKGKFIVELLEITMRPTISVPINDQSAAERVLRVVSGIEELEDVQQVYANFDIPEEILGKALLM